MTKFSDYTSVVFWDFKRRDNVEYNFTIIEILIADISNNHQLHNFYYKPIFITIMAIIECTIYDFLCRIQEHVHEKISLNAEDIDNIKNLNLPAKLKNYNDICKKYKLFGEENPSGICQSIEALLETRNRIHIQNDKHLIPADERYLWTSELVKYAGRTMKELFLFLSVNYPRPGHIHDEPQLDSFPTPWDSL